MIKDVEDTIAAIATPLGEGGIGIIRLSGAGALNIADKIFIGKHKPSHRKTFMAHYGFIGDNHKNKKMVIDEVILTVMRAPATYTKEDIVEINCHGGIVSLRKILELVIANGARQAQPGEFTQRAFLNGRIDLAQAEAVLNIVNAKTDIALSCAMGQLQGVLSQRVNKLREELISIIAPLEAAIDFPDEQITISARKKYSKMLKTAANDIKKLIDVSDRGIMLQNGIRVVLAGAPNVGKSSIMNEFVEYERVIVTHISGTTRDVVEEIINVCGLAVRLADTAGVMDSDCVITRKSVDQSLIFLDKADLVLFVLDSSRKINSEDMRVARQLRGKKVIIIKNKTDLLDRIDVTGVKKILPKSPVIKISALQKKGIESLKKHIVKMFFHGEVVKSDGLLINNLRHKQILQQCYESLINAIKISKSEAYDECLIFEIRQALLFLGEIVGEDLNEDILNNIFSKFCIGK